jgi:hypothetical protein
MSNTNANTAMALHQMTTWATAPPAERPEKNGFTMTTPKMWIYVFNRKEKWMTTGAVAIVADSQASAEAWYRQEFDTDDYTVVQHAITNGLILIAEGYDESEMVASSTQKEMEKTNESP